MSRRLTVNPVLSRELRQRVRGRRAAAVLTAYLSLLVAAVGIMVWGLERSATSGSTMSQGIGQTLFGSLLFGILGLVCFIVPGVAAGAVAGERERLTLTPLQITLLTPGQLLRGKLLASLAYTTLLLVATLPLLAVTYVLGGVSVPQIAGGMFFVLATAAFLGVVSIWASTVLRRVQRATVVAYGLVGLLVVGTPIAYGVQIMATSSFTPNAEARRWESLLLLAPNPFLVTADALGHATGDGGSSGMSLFTPSQAALQRRDERRTGSSGPNGQFGFNPGVAREGTFGFNGPMATVVPAMPVPMPVPPPMPVTTVADLPSRTGTTIPDPGPRVFVDQGSASGGVIVNDGPFFPEGSELAQGRPGGDVTDRGPIWAWTFGWWAILGGAAYFHASRRLRLPSATGVRP